MRKRGALVLVIILVLLIVGGYYVFGGESEKGEISEELYCETASDCVPKEACHASSCVVLGFEENKEGILCSQSCEPGTFDCGQGSCGCVDNKCQGVFNE